jgi:hypothetical protein
MSGQTAPRGVTLEKNPDGSANPRYVDMLSEDPAIAGQKFCCISFVSPEKILKQKETFFFNEFTKQWGLAKSMEKFTKFVSFLSYKYHLKLDDVMKDMEEFTKDEQKSLFGEFSVEDEYKTFLDNHEERLQEEFDEANQFQTNTRGIKIRGCYNSLQEAELRAQTLRDWESGAHEIYTGQVGVWMPFHPEAYKTGRVEYLEPELNQLMHEKAENEKKAKDAFEARRREAKQRAIAENEKLAIESGNVLTQTLNENGELVYADGTNTTAATLAGLGSEVSSASIRSELFEGDNVVTDSMIKERNAEMAKMVAGGTNETPKDE